MATKTLRMDGNTGIVMITDYGTSTNAMGDPMSYLGNIYFHSALPYLQIFNGLIYYNLTVPALSRGVESWSSGGCGCYITTACVKYMHLHDDCDELITLRHFRDNYMLSSNNTKEMVDMYYSIAPDLVKAIETKEDAYEIFKHTYEVYILEAVRLIKLEKNREALGVYINAIEFLKKKVKE
ncbi:hypothetical protein EB001_03045 [bacterium]|nr:hypothetical protein [bacterium]